MLNFSLFYASSLAKERDGGEGDKEKEEEILSSIYRSDVSARNVAAGSYHFKAREKTVSTENEGEKNGG